MNNNLEKAIQHVIDYIKRDKFKFVSIDDISGLLKDKMGETYSSDLAIDTRFAVMNHKDIDYFMEEDYVHHDKFHYSTGEWISIKGLYGNPVEAKFKKGWYAWQDSEDIKEDN